MAGYTRPPAPFRRRNRRWTMTASHPAQRGIALMLVLWVITLLTIIAVSLTAAQRTESTLAGNQLATARFRAAADAGINWSVLNLLTPPTVFDEEADPWIPDGTARTWIFAGETLELRVYNEGSRIDLNSAEREVLEALFAAQGLPEDEASALADAIEDWRDTNDLTELNGAEDGDYEDAGRSYGAKDGPFDSVQELQLVLGVDRNLYRELASALTVSPHGNKLDQEFASPLVHAALQGITLEEAELEQEEREAREARAKVDGSEVSFVSRGGPIYRIRVTQLIEKQAGQTMEALVSLKTGGTSPFEVLWRRFGLTTEPPDSPIGNEEEDG